MKVLYCDHCEDISIKSRFEPETCNACRRFARRVAYTRPWQYYVSSAILLAATAVLVLAPIPDLRVRAVIVGVAVAVALAFSSWSIRSLRVQILQTIRESKEGEAKA